MGLHVGDTFRFEAEAFPEAKAGARVVAVGTDWVEVEHEVATNRHLVPFPDLTDTTGEPGSALKKIDEYTAKLEWAPERVRLMASDPRLSTILEVRCLHRPDR